MSISPLELDRQETVLLDLEEKTAPTCYAVGGEETKKFMDAFPDVAPTLTIKVNKRKYVRKNIKDREIKEKAPKKEKAPRKVNPILKERRKRISKKKTMETISEEAEKEKKEEEEKFPPASEIELEDERWESDDEDESSESLVQLLQKRLNRSSTPL